MESVSAIKVKKSEIDFFDEPMDTSETALDPFYEEGEINSSDDELGESEKGRTSVSATFTRNYYKSSLKGETNNQFSVFDDDEMTKKLDRARRFALPVKANSISSDHKDQIDKLCRDLGIDKENERHYRFNAVHMRGTQNMSTEDVFEYFESCKPSHIEWVNDASCNIIWLDDVSAAKALLSVSRKIKNLDKVHLNANPFEKELKKSESVVESGSDNEAVDAREIKTAIPPGYWRIGIEAPKSSIILLRYATKSDKKQRNAEKNSEYYKKYGNPHYGNLPGVISKSLRNEMKKSRYKSRDSGSIWDNNKEEFSLQSNQKNNPWEELAYEWGKSEKVENVPDGYTRSNKNRITKTKLTVPDLRISLNNKEERRKRLKSLNDDSYDTEAWETRIKVPRMKMYADDVEEKSEKNMEGSPLQRSQRRIPVRDLRSKINQKKSRVGYKFGSERKQTVYCQSDTSNSDNEYDDGDSGAWALEHYCDLRESLDHNRRYDKRSFNGKYDSPSESESSDIDEIVLQGNTGQRSPLQIEIDNDEYYQDESNK